MDTTTSISLGGQIFSIGNEAYSILNRYLDHVAAKFSNEQDADETLFDIESRIAEIFGGGQEPPVLISEDMVNNMISIMGAPEEYYEDGEVEANDGRGKSDRAGQRKEMYNPNSPSASTGKALSSFFKATGNVFHVIFRFLAIIIGFCLTVTAVLTISSIVAVALFPESPLISPDIVNLNGLLVNVLGTEDIWQYVIMAGIVVFLPLLAMANAGLFMMFRINRVSRELSMALFIVWLVAVCALSFSIISNLRGFNYNSITAKRYNIDVSTDTLYIQTVRRADIDEIDYASIDNFILWRDERTGDIHGNSVLRISSTDYDQEVICRKYLLGDNRDTNRSGFDDLQYSIDFRGDTLFLDEYYTYHGAERWDGARVEVDLRVPEGTILKPVNETSFAIVNNHITDAYCYEVRRSGLKSVFENR